MIAGGTLATPSGTDPVPRAHRSARRRARRARRRLLVAVLVVVVAVAGVIVGVVATRSTSPGPAAGMSLAFDPSFSGNSLDNATWGTCFSWFNPAKGCTNFGNSIRDEWYLPSGVRVSGGTLRLVATKKKTEGTTKTGAPLTYPYTSGMVTTRKSFDFTYGYVQIEAKTPGGTGTWPALWLLPKNEVWPPEIDIMENWGSTRTIRTTFFWSDAGTVDYARQNDRATSNLTVGYHTYGLLWRPGSLTWYLDGKAVYKYTGSSVPHEPMYLLANMAVAGHAASGSTFSIRSVQIYRYDSSK